MKDVFVQYATYNAWANKRLLNLIESLPEQQQKHEVRSSYAGLFKTVLHMVDAESIWWQRVKLQENVVRISESFTGDFSNLSATLQELDRQWLNWISTINEHGLQHEFIYFNSKKERFKQPVYQMLLHLFNHNTYHRGQLVTILRQLDIEKIPPSDFIVWTRKK